jgi:hypothetical protein
VSKKLLERNFMNDKTDFKTFVSGSKHEKGFATYTPLSIYEFRAICLYVTYSDDEQLILFPLFTHPVKVSITLIKLVTNSPSPISYKELAQKFSLNEKVIKARLSDLAESGFPIHLTNTAVRMKTQPEVQATREKEL